jgi:predicted AlkP superfamily pyrophosphatase or phosphodiesterase
VAQLIAGLLLALTAGACTVTAPKQQATPKAIFIIVDGIPADVLEQTDTPHMDDIAGDRGYTRAWVGGEAGGPSESPTVSAVGYMSLITGTWSNKHNVYDNDVTNPDYTYWDIFRIAKTHNPSLHTAIFSTWLDNRTKLVGDGLPEAGGNKLDYHFDGFEHDTERFPHDVARTYIRDIDEAVSNEAARYIEAEGPDVSWVYLEFTDDVAHTMGDGPQLRHAVTVMDDYVGRIWNAVQKRQAAQAEDWLVIVTTDHGRDAVNGKDHGGQSERERTTWIVTNSRNLNDRFAKMPPVVDILPSIVEHLGLGMPPAISAQLDGQSFID